MRGVPMKCWVAPEDRQGRRDPVRELGARSLEGTVVVERILVVAGTDQGAVAPVGATREAQDHLVDVVPVEHLVDAAPSRVVVQWGLRLCPEHYRRPDRRDGPGYARSVSSGLEIRPARPDEAAAISALARASKAVWDYTPEQLAVFAEELTLRPEDILPAHTRVLTDAADGLLGFYSFAVRPDGRLELDHLFVAATRLREGLGRRLLRSARELASNLGHERFVVQSDPNAEGFYLSEGARLLERIPSSIPGRSIPFLELSTG